RRSGSSTPRYSRRRRAGRSVGRPYTVSTIEDMPAPMPRGSRLPVAARTVSAWRASPSGWRCGHGTTGVPNSIHGTRPAPAVAGEGVAEQGAEASLEEIARRAGVGSATLHRHFGSRPVLLEAVFRSRIDAVCTEAEDLLDAPDPASALVGWLRSMVAHATANR